MLKGPSWYNPRLHPERALQRRNTVINQMIKYDFLPEETGEKYKDTELELQYKAIEHYSGLAPYLREKIRQDAVKIIDAYNSSHLTKLQPVQRRADSDNHPRRGDATLCRRSGQKTHEATPGAILYPLGQKRALAQPSASIRTSHPHQYRLPVFTKSGTAGTRNPGSHEPEKNRC